MDLSSLLNESDVCTETIYGPKRDSLYIIMPMTVIYVIILISGIVGNVTTCLVIWKTKSLHTATNYYLFSLAVSDLVFLVVGLPHEIYLIWYRYPYIFGEEFCFFRGLLAETSGNASVLTITGFTVERYLAICHPILSHTMSNLSRAVKFIFLFWAVAFGLAIPLALPLKVRGTCPLCLPTDPIISHYFEITTCVFFAAPMILIIVLYVLIRNTLNTSNKMKAVSGITRIHTKSSKKVVNMLIAVVAAFFICWAPFHLQRLYTVYTVLPKSKQQMHPLNKIYDLITYISGIPYYLSATVNPILYSIMSAKFRAAFKVTLFKCCGTRVQWGKSTEQKRMIPSRTHPRGQLGSRTESTGSTKAETIPTNMNCMNFDDFFTGNTTNFKSCFGPKKIGARSRNTRPCSNHTSPPVASKNREKFPQYFVRLKKDASHHRFPERPIGVELQRNGGKTSKRDSFDKNNISNSSLKDIEIGAIEGELNAYMSEVKDDQDQAQLENFPDKKLTFSTTQTEF